MLQHQAMGRGFFNAKLRYYMSNECRGQAVTDHNMFAEIKIQSP
jgi:hypothetical protein